jgi:pSer/pThr/pTyr-binding forkhead associated (FHA) protein
MCDAFQYARMQPGRTPGNTPTILQPLRAPVQRPAIEPSLTPVNAAGPRLYCRSGEFSKQNIPLTKPGITIGRGSNNQIQLQERSVSRTHISFISTKRGIYIRDEHSSLGTNINGQRIAADIPILLHHGDVIQIGYYQVFEFLEK